MFWNIAQPLDTGWLHRCIGVEALGDCVGDDGLAFLGQHFEEPLLLCNQVIDLHGRRVEKSSNGDLLFKRWQCAAKIFDDTHADVLLSAETPAERNSIQKVA